MHHQMPELRLVDTHRHALERRRLVVSVLGVRQSCHLARERTIVIVEIGLLKNLISR
jgi:hypothetical protein